jgi:predicted Zn finger-like uncharacterized protein
MSLATRCAACGTVFRVVQDQLRVSEGWVRCGRCAEVFNAVESLVDLEAETPVRVGGASAHRDRVIEDLARVAGQAEPTPRPSWSAGSALDTLPVPPAPPAASSAPAAWPEADSDLDDWQPAAPAPELRAEAPPFVRQAERAASWRRSPLRAVLAVAVLAAASVLALQVALAWRDLIAARWPSTQPALAWWCGFAGCRIEAPRLADALVVESSGLLRVDQSSNYTLSVVLRNRAAIDLAVPAIDLTLTDAQGRVIARRVLDAGELGVTQRSLAGSGELSMKAMLAVGDRAVSGYTIEVFYP